jgi:two-component system chemotaxis response regulator CheB
VPKRNIVVVGASAGGIAALRRLIEQFPAGLPASIFVVVHVPAEHRSMLPSLLERAGRLPAAHPSDGDGIECGRIYVAPPDRHMVIEHGRVRLARGARENHHRPAIDALFRSAAQAFGPQVIGVVLSGSLDDGTAGLIAIKRHGGVAVVQDPDDADYPEMVRSALANDHVDHSLPVADMGALIERLIDAEVPEMPRELDPLDKTPGERPDADKPPSAFSCPDCGGVLFEDSEGSLEQFRCRVGHVFSPESLLAGQHERVEESLWTALRSLEEHIALYQRLCARAEERKHYVIAGRYREREREMSDAAAVLRRMLQTGGGAPRPGARRRTPAAPVGRRS